MQHTKTVTRPVEEHSYTCDRCGAAMTTVESDGRPHTRGLVASCSGGYGQMFPPDGEVWRFDLCEGCVAWLAGEMKRYPFVHDYVSGDPTPDPRIRDAVRTGDFLPLLATHNDIVAATRAIARRQADPELVKTLDCLAATYAHLAVTSHAYLGRLRGEVYTICRGMIDDPSYFGDDPEELVARAKAAMPDIGRDLASRDRALGIIIESAGANPRELRNIARAEYGMPPEDVE